MIDLKPGTRRPGKGKKEKIAFEERTKNHIQNETLAYIETGLLGLDTGGEEFGGFNDSRKSFTIYAMDFLKGECEDAST